VNLEDLTISLVQAELADLAQFVSADAFAALPLCVRLAVVERIKKLRRAVEKAGQ
jgi:hypothetical protein